MTMGVNAQTTLKVESFRMGIGEQKTITLDLDNAGLTDAAAFCCNIYIPEGVEVEKDTEGNRDNIGVEQNLFPAAGHLRIARFACITNFYRNRHRIVGTIACGKVLIH